MAIGVELAFGWVPFLCRAATAMVYASEMHLQEISRMNKLDQEGEDKCNAWGRLTTCRYAAGSKKNCLMAVGKNVAVVVVKRYARGHIVYPDRRRRGQYPYALPLSNWHPDHALCLLSLGGVIR